MSEFESLVNKKIISEGYPDDRLKRSLHNADTQLSTLMYSLQNLEADNKTQKLIDDTVKKLDVAHRSLKDAIKSAIDQFRKDFKNS